MKKPAANKSDTGHPLAGHPSDWGLPPKAHSAPPNSKVDNGGQPPVEQVPTSPGQWGPAGTIGDQPPANAWGTHPSTGTYLGSHPSHPTDAGTPRHVPPPDQVVAIVGPAPVAPKKKAK